MPSEIRTTFVAVCEPELVYEAQVYMSKPDFRALPSDERLPELVDRLAGLVATEEDARMHWNAYTKHVCEARKDRLGAWAGTLAALHGSGFLEAGMVREAAEGLLGRSQVLQAPKVANFALHVYTNSVTKDSVGRKS